MSIETPEELEGMKAAGAVVRRVIEAMEREARAGVSTAELDEVGARVMRENGARSAPGMVYGFPGANCISVNDEAVHGVPGARRLSEGDLLKLDVTVEKDGFMADAAVTVAVGKVSEERRRLMECAESAFGAAMGVARAGARVVEVGRVIEKKVRGAGFSVIRELGGHGIGRTIHEEPSVPNFGDPAAREILTEGMVITVEPIIAAGSAAAHFEQTVMITKGAPVVLTA